MNDMIGWGAGLALIGLIVWATVAIAGSGGRTAARRRGGRWSGRTRLHH